MVSGPQALVYTLKFQHGEGHFEENSGMFDVVSFHQSMVSVQGKVKTARGNSPRTTKATIWERTFPQRYILKQQHHIFDSNGSHLTYSQHCLLQVT